MVILDARGLQYFLEVAETLHFGRAAERLFISQSTVSEVISRLEISIGGQLFDRAGRRIRLTTLGEKLFRDVHQPIISLERAIADAQSMALDRAQVLRIGFLGGGLYELHTETIEALRRQAPNVEPEFVELDISHYFSSVINGEVDIAIVRRPPEDGRLKIGPVIRQDPVVIVVPKNHRFVGRPYIDVEELAGELLVRFDTGMPSPSSWVTSGGPERTPSGKLIGTANTVRTIREALTSVAGGAGIAVFAGKLFDYYSDPGIEVIPLDGVIADSVLCWRRSDDRASIRLFSEAVMEVARRHGLASS